MVNNTLTNLCSAFRSFVFNLLSVDYESAVRGRGGRLVPAPVPVEDCLSNEFAPADYLAEQNDDSLPDFEGTLSECRAVIHASSRVRRLSNISQYRLAAYVATLPPAERASLDEHPFDCDVAACA